MNGLADWPHFYFNVEEVGIIIGRGATLFPLLIDVLFSTLGAVTRPKSNARAHNHHLQGCRKCTFIRGGERRQNSGLKFKPILSRVLCPPRTLREEGEHTL